MSHRMSAVVCTCVLIVLTRLAAAQGGIEGVWTGRHETRVMAVRLLPDGTFLQVSRDLGLIDILDGTYEVSDQLIVFHSTGALQPVTVAYQRVGPDTMAIRAQGGVPVQLTRVAGPEASGVGLGAPRLGLGAPPEKGDPQATVLPDGQEAALEDPVPPEVTRLAETVIGATKANAGRHKPPAPVPGWPVVREAWGSVQHPPTWVVRQSEAQQTGISDPRGLCSMHFATCVRFKGSRPWEDMGQIVFQSVLGTTPVVMLAADEAPAVFANDGGRTLACFLRWVHPRAGKMLTALSLSILARVDPAATGALAASIQGGTTITWSMYTCPEAEAVKTHREVFGPMAGSFRFPIPKGDLKGEDKDGDGWPDAMDEFPEDPNRH